MMAQIGVDQQQQQNQHNGHGKFESTWGDNSGGWVDMNHNYNSAHAQSPVYENGIYGQMPYHHQQQQHGMPTESQLPPPRMAQAPPPQYQNHQQLLPLIMPNHSQTTWPSMLTNPVNSNQPPVAIPPAPAPLAKSHLPKLPAIHTTPSPRKTLTDLDRRRMCEYHAENPSVKQTEIGGEQGNFLV